MWDLKACLDMTLTTDSWGVDRVTGTLSCGQWKVQVWFPPDFWHIYEGDTCPPELYEQMPKLNRRRDKTGDTCSCIGTSCCVLGETIHPGDVYSHPQRSGNAADDHSSTVIIICILMTMRLSMWPILHQQCWLLSLWKCFWGSADTQSCVSHWEHNIQTKDQLPGISTENFADEFPSRSLVSVKREQLGSCMSQRG